MREFELIKSIWCSFIISLHILGFNYLLYRFILIFLVHQSVLLKMESKISVGCSFLCALCIIPQADFKKDFYWNFENLWPFSGSVTILLSYACSIMFILDYTSVRLPSLDFSGALKFWVGQRFLYYISSYFLAYFLVRIIYKYSIRPSYCKRFRQ